MAEPEREVIVTRDGGGGSGGWIVAVILLLAIIVGLFFVFGGNFMKGGDATDIKADVKIDTPAPNK